MFHLKTNHNNIQELLTLMKNHTTYRKYIFIIRLYIQVPIYVIDVMFQIRMKLKLL